ncbi:VanZ family protein [Moritella sp. Urea-trap-13]|uniref:VanZ family protein n=1 Tax=Moritella sp. Urea-trap-13 TaxID=2058327 RepID=UPI000C342EB9|nr:VanZ family protein [Moritella sp. Urea-trap-13]PKH07293.1 antibiotic resistance protein VanZ [Moritella sp. Urea-trap-13]
MALNKYKFWFRLLLAMVIFTICIIAFGKATTDIPQLGYDKLNHLIAFASLALLFDYSFPNRTITLFMTLLGFGIFIEFIQGMIPSRTTSYWDILADLIGITSYLILQPLRAKIHG